MSRSGKISNKFWLVSFGLFVVLGGCFAQPTVQTMAVAASSYASDAGVVQREIGGDDQACPLIQYGQIFDDKLANGEEKCHGFNAKAGDRVTVAVDLDLCCYRFSLALHTPQNGVWSCDYAASFCEIDNVELPLDGYYIVVVDAEKNDGGGYALSVNHLNDKTESIVAGTPVAQEISPAGDQDAYRFLGGAGHRISALLDKGLCCASFSLKLTKPDGTFWICGFTSADCLISNVTLPETGTYTLTVDGQWESADDYKLQLTCEYCPPIPTITPTSTAVPTPMATPTPRAPAPNDVYLPAIVSGDAR